MKSILRKKWVFVCVFAVSLLLAEVVIRFLGVINFPLYLASSEVGYELAPNQSGEFFGGKRWNYNEYGMSSGPFLPEKRTVDILLVGDSVVLGGNNFDMSDRLGAKLEKELGFGYKVWPIAAGSWSLLNELAWLKRNKQVVDSVDLIVFVSNIADFAEPSSWSCEETHPRERPYLAIMHVLKKYSGFFPLCANEGPRDLVFRDRLLSREIIEFSKNFSKKTIAFYFPNKNETLYHAIPSDGAHKFKEIFSSADVPMIGEKFIDNGWVASYYIDEIHPNLSGYSFLAKYLSLEIKQNVLSLK